MNFIDAILFFIFPENVRFVAVKDKNEARFCEMCMPYFKIWRKFSLYIVSCGIACHFLGKKVIYYVFGPIRCFSLLKLSLCVFLKFHIFIVFQLIYFLIEPKFA